MPYRVVEIKELDAGHVYFTVDYWSDLEAMNSGAQPDWRNDFVTDLNRLAAADSTTLKFQHDNAARSSKMQRADTGEWLPVEEWVRKGGLLQQGVGPAYESVTASSTTVHAAVKNTVSVFQQRRELAASKQSRWAQLTDYRSPSLQDRIRPSTSSGQSSPDTLPEILLALAGRVEESV